MERKVYGLLIRATRTLTVPTDELKEAFGFPTDIDKDFYYEPPEYRDEDIISTLETLAEESEEGENYSERQISAMRSALYMAEESAHRDAADKAVLEAVDLTLDTFTDYQYEYMEEAGEEGMQSFSGTAKGIISQNVGWENTEIVVDEDFAHVIRDILSGDGTFDPSALPLDASDEEILGHLHWLPRYYDIYGGGAPQPDYPDYPDIDMVYLKERYEEELAEAAVGEV